MEGDGLEELGTAIVVLIVALLVTVALVHWYFS